VLVAMALLHAALGRDHAGWNFLVGYVAGVAFMLPHTWWAAQAADLTAWIALTAVLQAPFFGLFGSLWTWARRLPALRRPGWLRALVFALVWTSVEQWRSQVPFGGFPWGRLAWSVAAAPTGRAAWLGGSVLVTFILALAGALLVLVLRNVRRRRPLQALAVLAVGAGLLYGPAELPLPYSPYLAAQPDPPVTAQVDHRNRAEWATAGTATAETGVLTVGIVQGDNDNAGGDPVENARRVLDSHLAGTRALADDIAARQAGDPWDNAPTPLMDQPDTAVPAELDIVLWPEDSSGWDPARRAEVGTALSRASRQVGAPILVGSQEFPDSGGRYNVMLLWGPQGLVDAGGLDGGLGGTVGSRYAKQRPAPFGEYIPLRPLLERLSDQVARVTTDMIAADNPPIIELPSQRLGRIVRIGVGICFEVAYDQIFVDAARQGAEFLVVPTNNASFGVTPQSTQQLHMTRLQAIATGRAAVQVSTVGVSGVIAPDGTLVARTGLFTADHVAAAIPLRTTLTPAVIAGQWPGLAASALGPLLALAGIIAGRGACRRASSFR
jgi:apolipoprotein N-acyltransferase